MGNVITSHPSQPRLVTCSSIQERALQFPEVLTVSSMQSSLGPVSQSRPVLMSEVSEDPRRLAGWLAGWLAADWSLTLSSHLSSRPT